MKGVGAWLLFSLLLALAGSSPGRAAQPQPDQPGAGGPTLLSGEPLKDDPRDDELQKLLKARYNAAVYEVQSLRAVYPRVGVSRETIDEAEQRRLRAGLELCDTPADKIALLTQYLRLATEAEERARASLGAGRVPEATVQRARYQRLDVEIQLLRAKREAEKAKRK